MVNGVVMKASLWLNKDKNGQTYFGLGFQSMEDAAKYSKEHSTATPTPQFDKPQATAKVGDDLPF